MLSELKEWDEFMQTLDLGSGTGASGQIKDVTTATFMQDVIEASRQAPVIVDFWAPWCSPCKQLAPLLEKAVASHAGKVTLAKVNVDENQAIAGQLQIQSLPTVYAFADGRPVDGFLGVQSESEIKAFVDRLVGTSEADELADVIDSAEKALEAGDIQDAAEAFAAVLQIEQSNPDAIAGLASCYLKSGDSDRAEQTLKLVPESARHGTKVARVLAALELAKSSETAGDLSDLEGKLAAHPTDHQARLDLAKALASKGRKEDAVNHLLEIVRKDRAWNDEAARKQLVQFFDAWGPKDPATLEGRRKLSSILFS